MPHLTVTLPAPPPEVDEARRRAFALAALRLRPALRLLREVAAVTSPTGLAAHPSLSRVAGDAAFSIQCMETTAAEYAGPALTALEHDCEAYPREHGQAVADILSALLLLPAATLEAMAADARCAFRPAAAHLLQIHRTLTPSGAGEKGAA